jgi:hypothetical protein
MQNLIGGRFLKEVFMIRKAGFILLLAIFIIAAQFCSGEPSDSKEKSKMTSDGVENGGFEVKSPESGDPQGWYATRLPETMEHVEFGSDAEQAHEGDNSVFISIKKTHPEKHSGGPIAYNWTQVIPFEIGKTYELTGWVKTQDLKTPAFIVVQCWATSFENMALFTTQREYKIIGSNDWTPVKVAYTVPSGTGEVRIRAGIRAPDNIGGKVWFDDIQVKLLSY